MYHFICATYASKTLDFSKKANVVIISSSGVARQHRKAREDLTLIQSYKRTPIFFFTLVQKVKVSYYFFLFL